LAVVSVLLCVVPFSLFAWAEQHISSGLASIYNATTPLMTMLVALVALPQERGAALAQAGSLLATACYGISFVYLRRFVAPRGLPAVPLAKVQVGLGAILMLLAAPLVAAQRVQLTGRVTLSSWSWVSSGPAWRTCGTPTSWRDGAQRTPPRSPTSRPWWASRSAGSSSASTSAGTSHPGLSSSCWESPSPGTSAGQELARR
jgi:drug/metabolite transporter (DMT)-like permease